MEKSTITMPFFKQIINNLVYMCRYIIWMLSIYFERLKFYFFFAKCQKNIKKSLNIQFVLTILFLVQCPWNLAGIYISYKWFFCSSIIFSRNGQKSHKMQIWWNFIKFYYMWKMTPNDGKYINISLNIIIIWQITQELSALFMYMYIWVELTNGEVKWRNRSHFYYLWAT